MPIRESGPDLATNDFGAPVNGSFPWRCVIDGSLANRLIGTIGVTYLLTVGVLALVRERRLPFPWEHPLGAAGLTLLLLGNYFGLVLAPAERYMGDAGRILYVHVPAAWLSMLCFGLASLFALAYLLTSRRGWDSAMEAACELGVVEGTLLLFLGSVFAKPTWGVWWTWDARLTATAVMLLSFVGVLLLRGIVREPERRATWSAVATILAGVNLPVTYMSVKCSARFTRSPPRRPRARRSTPPCGGSCT